MTESWKYGLSCLVFFLLLGAGIGLYNYDSCVPIPGQRWEVEGVGRVIITHKIYRGTYRSEIGYSLTEDNDVRNGEGKASEEDFCSSASISRQNN
jgi:hypothetical protein